MKDHMAFRNSNFSENYCATYTELSEFLPIAGSDFIKHANVMNSKVIVSHDAEKGQRGLYFPIETEIADWFLKENNLFSSPQLNLDKTKKGYFGNTGRVRAVKFRGAISDGFFFPIEISHLDLGAQINCIDTVELCKKYTVSYQHPKEKVPNKPRRENEFKRILSGHFPLHLDTKNLRRTVEQIDTDDYIEIAEKWHGCNATIGKPLCTRKLNFFENLLAGFGVNISKQEYCLVAASRRVMKYLEGVEVVLQEIRQGYYKENVWKTCAKEISDKIPPGWVLYGEIVGYAGDKPIQKGYTYGFQPGECGFYCFAIKIINPNGLETDLTGEQVQYFCELVGINHFSILFSGKAKDFFSNDDDVDKEWHPQFLQELETVYTTNATCVYNSSKVPAEGIVLSRYKNGKRSYFKLKNWAFLEFETKALDDGTEGIEE
jgi:hypothetical protein